MVNNDVKTGPVDNTVIKDNMTSSGSYKGWARVNTNQDSVLPCQRFPQGIAVTTQLNDHCRFK